MHWLPLLAFALVIAVFCSIYAYQLKRQKIRHDSMAELASSLGLEFSSTAAPPPVMHVDRLPLFSHGRTRKTTNLIQGERTGLSLDLFDYKYRVGSGDRSQTRQQTVIAIRSASLRLPAMHIAPENPLHKIGSFLGFKDINFESHPEFSKRYWVSSNEEQHVRSIMTPAVLDYLESHKGLSIETCDEQFILFRERKLIPVDQIQDLLKTAVDIYQLLSGDPSGSARRAGSRPESFPS